MEQAIATASGAVDPIRANDRRAVAPCTTEGTIAAARVRREPHLRGYGLPRRRGPASVDDVLAQQRPVLGPVEEEVAPRAEVGFAALAFGACDRAALVARRERHATAEHLCRPAALRLGDRQQRAVRLEHADEVQPLG